MKLQYRIGICHSRSHSRRKRRRNNRNIFIYIVDAVFDGEVEVVLEVRVVVVDVRLLHDVAAVRGARVVRNAVAGARLLDVQAAPPVAHLRPVERPAHLRADDQQ